MTTTTPTSQDDIRSAEEFANEVMVGVQGESLARDQVRELLSRSIETDRARRAGPFADLHAYQHATSAGINYTVVQIDTTAGAQERNRIYVNDGCIFDGDPISATDELRRLVELYDNDEYQDKPYETCEWLAEGIRDYIGESGRDGG
ncbi:hypothetical protein [Microbacterium paraoxydans]|uniref:hypothetical protein n=1 Tax=Microbacterium paraoxydans TaxID=199592 RepID=UPI0021A73617|nr:hypothetical protein [Microbacterium paraoxydans]MCT2225025.1 hypothetical protein [Microbacterium paraoxydans]